MEILINKICRAKSHNKIELDKPLFLSQLEIEHLTNIMNKIAVDFSSFPKEEQLFAFPDFHFLYNLNTN